MRFSFFNTAHHEMGQRSLDDICEILGQQLWALGHEAKLDPKNRNIDTAFVLAGDANDVNVMIEGFTPAWVEIMRRFRAGGARFVIVATEEPTPKGFNWGRDRGMVLRQEIFPQAAALSEGIIHLVPGKHITDWFGQYAPSAQADLGYAPTLVRNHVEPEHDFGFYGSMTDRRKKILQQLSRLNGGKPIVTVTDFRNKEDRDRRMQTAKVILQVRKFDELGLVSSSRCSTALCLRRPVVAEPHDLSKPWDEVIDFAPTMDSFYSRALLAARMWRETWRVQFERFKAKMTPEFCVGEPLRRIGIIKPEVELISMLPNPEAIAAAKARRRALMGGPR